MNSFHRKCARRKSGSQGVAPRSFGAKRGEDTAFRPFEGKRHATRPLCPYRWRLRHRRHRIRHHGPAARCQRRSRRLDLGRRPADFRLCARRGRRRAAAWRHRRPLVEEDAADEPDGGVHRRQSRLRAGARLLDADGRPRAHRLRPCLILRRRLGRRHRSGAGQQEGVGHRHHVHRSDRRQHPRRALRHLARPGLWLALDLLGGDAGRRHRFRGDRAAGAARQKGRRGGRNLRGGAGGSRPPHGAARPAHHSAFLGRRLCGLHLHRADPHPHHRLFRSRGVADPAGLRRRTGDRQPARRAGLPTSGWCRPCWAAWSRSPPCSSP